MTLMESERKGKIKSIMNRQWVEITMAKLWMHLATTKKFLFLAMAICRYWHHRVCSITITGWGDDIHCIPINECVCINWMKHRESSGKCKYDKVTNESRNGGHHTGSKSNGKYCKMQNKHQEQAMTKTWYFSPKDDEWLF